MAVAATRSLHEVRIGRRHPAAGFEGGKRGGDVGADLGARTAGSIQHQPGFEAGLAGSPHQTCIPPSTTMSVPVT